MKALFFFAGQGAQAVGMGRELAAVCPEAASVFARADAALGWPVSKICFEGPDEALTETRRCQPAIYTMSVACLAAFKARFPGVRAAGAAGLSLGELTALHAAGCYGFEEGLRLVARRAELMQAACEATCGAMASVLKADPADVARVCAAHGVDVANYNCPGQIVVSGEKAALAKACEALKAECGAKVVPLKVAGAYHSRLMASAERQFAAVLAGFSFPPPAIPVAQNYSGAVESDPVRIHANLGRQITGSVRWEECVRALRAHAPGACAAIEFGPGSVLAGLAKRIDPALPAASVDGPSALDSLAAGLLKT